MLQCGACVAVACCLLYLRASCVCWHQTSLVRCVKSTTASNIVRTSPCPGLRFKAQHTWHAEGGAHRHSPSRPWTGLVFSLGQLHPVVRSWRCPTACLMLRRQLTCHPTRHIRASLLLFTTSAAAGSALKKPTVAEGLAALHMAGVAQSRRRWRLGGRCLARPEHPARLACSADVLEPLPALLQPASCLRVLWVTQHSALQVALSILRRNVGV